jgi:hypothetical protein
VNSSYRISVRTKDGVRRQEFPSEEDYRRRLRELEEEGATFTHHGPEGWGAAWKMSDADKSLFARIPLRQPGEPLRHYRLSDLRRGIVVPVEDEHAGSPVGATRK